ncbi:hypothetical protein E2C01_027844 [Portunus trituberculatus]|uniref:Uncharacterized protein n=1 Tax=Portunus trituberculatus TaxID=210409 RepID=A0A5B7ENA0_PORTR|nr:hypothetical protein [Portunus trituberculatus]
MAHRAGPHPEGGGKLRGLRNKVTRLRWSQRGASHSRTTKSCPHRPGGYGGQVRCLQAKVPENGLEFNK